MPAAATRLLAVVLDELVDVLEANSTLVLPKTALRRGTLGKICRCKYGFVAVTRYPTPSV